MWKTASAFLAFVLAGCATTQQIANKPDIDVCMGYGALSQGVFASSSAPYFDEMSRRELLSDDETRLVLSKKLKIGMSLCAMYASWGKPNRENKTTYSGGVRIQHIYNAGYRYIKPTYVYTENGRVTAWQN